MNVFNTQLDWEIRTVIASWLHLSELFSLTCLPCSMSSTNVALIWGYRTPWFVPHSLFHIPSSFRHPFVSVFLANFSACCIPGRPSKHNITKVTKHSQAKPTLLLILPICVCIFSPNMFIKFGGLLEICFVVFPQHFSMLSWQVPIIPRCKK